LPDAPAFRFANALPVIIISVMAAVSLVWNGWAGISWRPALPPLLAGPALCFAIAAIYSTIRPQRVLAECALYVGLWLIYPIFATRLTYLALEVGYPLKDNLFAAADGALGFRWMHWADIVSAHPLFATMQGAAYESYLWQPVLSIIIFAVWGPRGRNGELLTSVLLAVLATIAVSTFLPAIGPADTHGFATLSGSVVRALRSGADTPFEYVGIVCFPSFHTAMAILFAAAHRGNRLSFPIFLILNVLMLGAIPYSGDHYLTDVIGGAVVAGCAIVGTRRLYGMPAVSVRSAAAAA
jgi:hypothetical protein